MPKRLPPGCGLALDKPVLYNPYIHDPKIGFHAMRKLRRCGVCNNVVTAETGSLQCPTCKRTHENNETFTRLFKSLHLRAGRRSGKSLGGAHAVRDEISVPNQRWWVCGPTFKILHDATMPTLLRLIPPTWVKDWNTDNLELQLVNDSVVQFRSLDDPERGRGQGLHGAWLDEAAFFSKRAWDVLSPSLAENAGVVISTTSPGGFDWTYHEFYKRAIIDKRPGYWAAKFKTLDNPLFARSAALRREVEEARQTMTKEFFAAEYEGDDVNFTGAIYGEQVMGQVLEDDEAVRRVLPEWPNIDSTRTVLVGLDSGADHPFGAVLIVVTEKGLVVVGEYLERLQAAASHLGALHLRFGLSRFANIRWAANKNEAQLRIEFGVRGIAIIPAENKHAVGIQRVQSWLQTGQLYFVKSHCPKTIEQMRTYKWADNYMADGQKRETEQVFKKDDELPDAIRYSLMSWPELPSIHMPERSERDQRRWDSYDEKTKFDIQQMRNFHKRSKDMQSGDEGYPIGDFFRSGDVATSVFE